MRLVRSAPPFSAIRSLRPGRVRGPPAGLTGSANKGMAAASRHAVIFFCLFLSRRAGRLALLLCVPLDQAEQVVGQRLAGNFVVHGVQLLLQPDIEWPLARSFHFCPRRFTGAILFGLVVTGHGTRAAE